MRTQAPGVAFQETSELCIRRELGDVAEVRLDRAANLLPMSLSDDEDYKQGRPDDSDGDSATKLTVRLAVPRPGHWRLVVDAGEGVARDRESKNPGISRGFLRERG